MRAFQYLPIVPVFTTKKNKKFPFRAKHAQEGKKVSTLKKNTGIFIILGRNGKKARGEA
jgi:hypothetical protein